MALLEAQAAGVPVVAGRGGWRGGHRRGRRRPACWSSRARRRPSPRPSGRCCSTRRDGAPWVVRRRRACWRGTIWRRRARGWPTRCWPTCGCRRARLPDPPRQHELERGRPHPGSDRHPAERSAGGRRWRPGGCRRASPTAACITSPLARARETAALLGFADPPERPAAGRRWRWGSFEGRTLAELRAEHGADDARARGRRARFPAARRREPAAGRRPAGRLSARARGDRVATM